MRKLTFAMNVTLDGLGHAVPPDRETRPFVTQLLQEARVDETVDGHLTFRPAGTSRAAARSTPTSGSGWVSLGHVH